MDPLTLIALVVLLAVGIPTMSYIGYKLHERLEHDKMMASTTTTTTTAVPITTPAPTQASPRTGPRVRTRQRTRRIHASWAAIPIIIAVTILARTMVDAWSRLLDNCPTWTQCPLTPTLPILAVAATLAALTAYNMTH